jgi:hypothetical protein
MINENTIDHVRVDKYLVFGHTVVRLSLHARIIGHTVVRLSLHARIIVVVVIINLLPSLWAAHRCKTGIELVLT